MVTKDHKKDEHENENKGTKEKDTIAFVYLEPDLRLPIVLNFNSAGKSILML